MKKVFQQSLNGTPIRACRELQTVAGKSQPPAAEFWNGQVQTRVYSNPTPWGEFEWKVSQVRIYPRLDGSGFSSSFSKRDLKDVARGAMQAEQFIRRVEWRIWKRRLFPWS